MKPSKQSQVSWVAKSLAVISIITLSGCATFTSPKEKPVIEDKIGKGTGTLAVTAERRVIIFNNHAKNVDPLTSICAEPSPDVAESISSTLKAVAEASVKKGGNETTASLEASKAFTTAIAPLLVRSQGIQYLRDGMYALCQAKMNGYLNNYKVPPKDVAVQKNTTTKENGNTIVAAANQQADISNETTDNLFVLLFNNILENSKTLIDAERPNINQMREEHAAGRAEQANGAAQLSATEAKASADNATDSAAKADISAKAAKADAATATTKAKEATDAANKADGGTK